MMRVLPLFLVCVLSALLAFALLGKKNTEAFSLMTGKAFPALTINSLQFPEAFKGKRTIVNLFASWCLPCIQEHSLLMKLKADNIAPIIGIAWKNKPADVEAWLAKRGNPFDQLAMDETGKSTVPLALTGVPETFIVDEKGIIIFHTKAQLTEQMIHDEMMPHLKGEKP